ncbi:hypothetical protein SGRIM128S_00817 [Streptomyces griseomycini]
MTTPLFHAAVLRTEVRLFRREPGNLFWIMLFPSLLLGILGAVPSFREADPSLGGLRAVDAYVPVAVLLGVIVAGVQGMPQTLTGYREHGILRRMATTPVRAAALLSAQMLVFGGAALVSALLALAVGRLAFDVRLPREELVAAVRAAAAGRPRVPRPGGAASRPGLRASAPPRPPGGERAVRPRAARASSPWSPGAPPTARSPANCSSARRR